MAVADNVGLEYLVMSISAAVVNSVLLVEVELVSIVRITVCEMLMAFVRA